MKKTSNLFYFDTMRFPFVTSVGVCVSVSMTNMDESNFVQIFDHIFHFWDEKLNAILVFIFMTCQQKCTKNKWISPELRKIIKTMGYVQSDYNEMLIG